MNRGTIAYNQMRGEAGSIPLCKLLSAKDGEIQMMEMRIRTAALAAVVAGLAIPVLVHAQGTGSQPGAGTAAPEAAPLMGASWHPNNEYWRHHDQLLLTDFGWLARFKDEDTKLGPPAAGENRVVFMGDSITEGWPLDKSFPGKPYVNRGISGQTTPQMLVRFYADVVALHPRIVHILAGTNDVAGNTGPNSPQDFMNNIRAMTDLARANGIKVLIGSIPPSSHLSWRPEVTPGPRIAELNAWLERFAAERHAIYVDYHAALAAPDGSMRADLTHDGVHPHRAGYALMRPLAESAIAQALR